MSIAKNTSLDGDLLAVIDRMSEKIKADATDALAKKEMEVPTALVPNQICRVSPFFPLERKETGRRNYLEEEIIIQNAWGRIVFMGPRLSTYEEDVLLAILAIINDPEKRKMGKFGDIDTYVYSGSLLPILKLAGFSRCKESYKRVRRACKLLMGSFLTLETYKYENGVRKISSTTMTNMVMFYREENSEYTIAINPFFYNLYIRGNFALLDVERRNKIKSCIGKSLYRFAISQQHSWRGHFITLAEALNINPDIPPFKKRERIKGVIKELVKLKILSEKSRIDGDVVFIERHISTKTKRKKAGG